MSTSRQGEPQSLRELAENLSLTFRREYKPNTSCNPATYLSKTCFDTSDRFRDELAQFNAQKLSFSHFGDELMPKNNNDNNNNNNNNNIGVKRNGMELDGPMHKKRKLNDNNKKSEDDEDEEDEDEDIDMLDNNKNSKKHKKKKIRLPEKYRGDEDFESLEAPPTEPSKADEFFDPISFCKINLEKESRINVDTKDYINNFELFNGNDIILNGEEIKYLNIHYLENYLKDRAINHGFTVQKDIATIFCLGLQDHLKNMFDSMDKWRKKRININNYGSLNRLKAAGICKQEWIDDINSKYSIKQQIVEAADEIEAFETEKADLDFKKMTGILSDEEKKRSEKLIGLIRRAKEKQKQNDQKKINDSSLTALGGDFSFNFAKNKNKNGNQKNKGRQLQSDKFYVIDVINMIQNHQKYNQQHLKELSKIYLKQT